MSGYTIYNNTFNNVETGIMLGGGRFTNITNNQFRSCNLGIEFDNRGGKGQWAESSSDYPSGDNWLGIAATVPLKAWLAIFPEILVMSRWTNASSPFYPGVPCNNSIRFNTYCNVTTFIDQAPNKTKSWFSDVSSNVQQCL